MLYKRVYEQALKISNMQKIETSINTCNILKTINWFMNKQSKIEISINTSKHKACQDGKTILKFKADQSFDTPLYIC